MPKQYFANNLTRQVIEFDAPQGHAPDRSAGFYATIAEAQAALHNRGINPQSPGWGVAMGLDDAFGGNIPGVVARYQPPAVSPGIPQMPRKGRSSSEINIPAGAMPGGVTPGGGAPLAPPVGPAFAPPADGRPIQPGESIVLSDSGAVVPGSILAPTITGGMPSPSAAGAGAGVLSVGALVGAGVPVAVARQVMSAFAGIFGRGTRVVQRGGDVLPLIPSWLIPFAGILGIEAGVDVVMDTITGVMDGGDLPAEVNPGTVVKRWVANGRPFVRLADGKVGTQKKDGVWKFWRPKKHIVLSASGAYNLADFLKADKALNKQAKKLSSALNRRAPRPKRTEKHTHGGMVDGAARVVNIETGGRG